MRIVKPFRSALACMRIAMFALVLPAMLHAQKLQTYPIPATIARNDAFRVQVRTPGAAWQPVEAYAVDVDSRKPAKTSMAYFDFEGAVEVAITATHGDVHTARIRPLSYGMTPQISGNTVSFTLQRPRNLSVEINGDTFNNLQLFAGAVEKNAPKAGDPNVLYYGPGFHDAGGKILMKSGQTLYLAGGAVLQASIVCDHVHDVHILGHGILYHGEDGIGINDSDGVEVQGVTVLNPSHYAVLAGNASHITIKDMKSFSAKGWGDGIDLFTSKHVLVDGVFMRNSDDNIAIYGHRWNFYGDSDDITVQNATLWADVAHPILVGTHGDFAKPELIEHLTFRNIDVLQQDEQQIDYQGCLALDASDGNLIRHVQVDGMRIEDIDRGQLFNFRVMFNKKYASGPGRGIEDVHLKDVSYNGSHATLSILQGYDEMRGIQDVVFENLRINGQLITDTMPGKPGYYKTGDMANIYVGDHVEKVVFQAAGVPGQAAAK